MKEEWKRLLASLQLLRNHGVSSRTEDDPHRGTQPESHRKDQWKAEKDNKNLRQPVDPW